MVGASGRARCAVTTLVALVSAGAGCAEISPETGELRMACVDADSDPAKRVSFATEIRPMMNGDAPGIRGCRQCHYGSNAGGSREGLLATGLDLETLQTLRRGGRSSPPDEIVVPGKPCSSALVQKLQGTFGGARMPRGGPHWDAPAIQLVIDWIAEGAEGADGE
ncbi:MAG: hypothetical protein KF850_22895 [Labilithrix sp.]|nr:hypothetical protein [Labilithrix sp.]